MKKLFALLLLAAMLLTGCTAPVAESQPTGTAQSQPPTTQPAQARFTVGICMPSNRDHRWTDSARELTQLLTPMDCRVELCFAEDDVQMQLQQVQQLIEQQVDCLVIAAIDSVSLAAPLQDARSAGIPVVAYDRLLMDTESVSAYVSFDYEAMGAVMGQFVVDELMLETAVEEERSYTAELLMGSPDNNNAVLLHKGLMAVLEPYFVSGALQSLSGRTAMEDTYILRWDGDTARQQCSTYLKTYYQDSWPGVLLTASDVMAQGCIDALQDAGCPVESWPIITGQGVQNAGALRIGEGKQAMSLWQDVRQLAGQCAQVVQQLLEETRLDAPNQVDNHVVSVPTWYCPTMLLDAENYRQVMESE